MGDIPASLKRPSALRGDRTVWWLLKLSHELKVGPEDHIRPYLLVYNAFDGSTCLRGVLTATLVVCQNTLNLALGHARGLGVTDLLAMENPATDTVMFLRVTFTIRC